MAAKLRMLDLESDVHEAISSWLLHKAAIPEDWKSEMLQINPMSYDEAQALGGEGCFELMCEARKTMLRLKPLFEALGSLSAAVQIELRHAQETYNAVGKMRGLVILPGELLAHVLDFAVNWDQTLPTPLRTRAAVKFSHVSRHFRDTAVSCARLWTNACANSSLMAMCLSRNKHIPLNVRLVTRVKREHDSEASVLVFDQTFRDLVLLSNRWGSLEIEIEHSEMKGSHVGDLKPCPSFCGLDVPSLHSFHILLFSSCITIESDLFHGLLNGFHAPNLRHLTSKHFFARGLRVKNLKTFDVTLNLDDVDFASAVCILGQMATLEDFHLTLTGNHYYKQSRNQSPSPFQMTCLPSVRRLQIDLSMPGYDYPDLKTLMLVLLSSLSFPGITDFRLGLSGPPIQGDVKEVSRDWEMMLLFQHSDMFSHVERFHLEVVDTYANRQSQGFYSVIIPFGLLPNMKELSIYCNTRLIPRNDFADNTTSPILQKLIIQTTKEGLQALEPFVKGVLRKQEEGGRWGSSHGELVIINASPRLSYKMDAKRYATRTFVGDAALQLHTDSVLEIPTYDKSEEDDIPRLFWVT
ncbi:hypothetical protein SCHPADRAFT_932381 [Schizopora paradoxa]|uniref:F-box domain-containing protein n=1 Tax=Schizopora paradoxa TaxID=27342 RepID=A0A0H2R6U7_9AGAM|nr:hypothetical protein SCHPADRAFT_932381 [Schizopora paradoxa]